MKTPPSHVIASLLGVLLPVVGVGMAAAQDAVTKPHTLGPAEQREPLTTDKGVTVREGRRILLDDESYPRKSGRLAAEPSVVKLAEGFEIRFALDAPDDVLVRVVDAEGATIRSLACGVLGSNAPLPFVAGSLAQAIRWDGRDALGRPAPEGCRVEVSVGLEPRFDSFIAHDPAQLLGEVVGLETDARGRVYVQLGTTRKTDPVMLRFTREGHYADMVYPSSLDALRASGRSLEQVWPYTTAYDGMVFPHRPRSWMQYAPYRADQRVGFPMRIDSEGTAWFAEASAGYPNWAAELEPFRLFHTPTEPFWFLETFILTLPVGPFAIDDKGCGYVATSPASTITGIYPDPLKSLNDPKAPGTIRKVNLKTGALVADFAFNGTQPLPEKSAYLGTTQTTKLDRWKDAGFVAPERDGPEHFTSLCDLAVDAQGRLLVVDGMPRRLKIYQPDGRWLGELTSLTAQGEVRTFAHLRSVAATADGFYLLGAWEGVKEKTFLAKCSGDPVRPSLAWTVDLHEAARYVAVDGTASPPFVWVGMGHGPATVARIVDAGSEGRPGTGLGGVPAQRLLDPRCITADGDVLFVYDDARQKVVRIDTTTRAWLEADVKTTPVSMMVDRARHRLLLSSSPAGFGAYSKGEERMRESGFLCLDATTLARQEFRIQSVYDAAELDRRAGKKVLGTEAAGIFYPWAKSYGGQFAGIDARGHLFVRDGILGDGFHKSGPSAKQPLVGVIREYDEAGRIVNPACCQLFNKGGSTVRDSAGNFYAVDLPALGFGQTVHDFPVGIMNKERNLPKLQRGGTRTWLQSDFTHLVKFPAAGGVRDTDSELWAHRGVSDGNAGGCYCDWPGQLLAVDASDRLYAANVDLCLIKVLDTAGNMIGRIGRYGNAETVPAADGYARELGFHSIYSVAASGDHLYATDKDLRRTAKIRLTYRETRHLPLP